ncbi:MAG: hypothetical protein A3H29_11200 [Acidobacteria bacterium RIFCSPLOWO2_02_FULL_67_21]|nr:MAG: hypothetical protein A3H29_11200 [Acidobacteria bacterium RIFCSPLOWO2_02_FULL_67_21]
MPSAAMKKSVPNAWLAEGGRQPRDERQDEDADRQVERGGLHQVPFGRDDGAAADGDREERQDPERHARKRDECDAPIFAIGSKDRT